MIKEIQTQIINMVFAIGCLVLYAFFPVEEYKFEMLVSALTFFLFLPILYTKIILKKDYITLGFTSFSLHLKDLFYLLTAVVVGGLIAFVVFTMQWGVQEYLIMLPQSMLYSFKAFIIYEILFTAVAFFLITFFVWGFVYSLAWKNPLYTFIQTMFFYTIVLWNFYGSLWMTLPFIIVGYFYARVRTQGNILYLFIASLCIALLIDTFIVQSFR